jgi:hypothetical protein
MNTTTANETYVSKVKPVRYDIVDNHTGAVVGQSVLRNRAHASATRRDQEYGAYRYYVRAVYAS